MKGVKQPRRTTRANGYYRRRATRNPSRSGQEAASRRWRPLRIDPLEQRRLLDATGLLAIEHVDALDVYQQFEVSPSQGSQAALEQQSEMDFSARDLPDSFTGPGPSERTTIWPLPQVLDGSATAGVLDSPASNASILFTTIEGINFDENADNTGFLQIPPDPHAAAGLHHVASVVNSSIEWHTKAGVEQVSAPLAGLFDSWAPLTSTFDPKVIYDQHADRFVVVTLERTEAPTTSRIFLGASDDHNPNGTWFTAAINSKLSIGGVDRWADYPGLAIDEEAIYITANMFSFGSPSFGGSRLWIVHKSQLYSGSPTTVAVTDPGAEAGLGTVATLQPAHMFGTAPAGLGTFLASSGWVEGGGNDLLSVIRLDDPLTAPTFSNQFVSLGDIDTGALPDAPQSGSATAVETNDPRLLNAVWRNEALWTTNTVNPPSGPDAGQSTAHWYRIDTANLGALVLADQGNVGGEDIAAATHTFFPAIAVDSADNMALGFAASAAAIFPGAYYTGRLASDPPGTVQPSGTLAEGIDFYVRTFSGTRNRWGDYSGISVDPANDTTFWIFNEYAMARGTPTSDGDGRWATRHGSFSLQESGAAFVTLQFVDLVGDPNLLLVGEPFDIKVRFTDVRDPMNPQAVKSGYADIEFDPLLLQVDSITYDANYPFNQTGTIGIGVVDEVGATDGLSPPLDDLVFTLHATAVASGLTTVESNAGESAFSQIVLFGDDSDYRNDTVYGEVPLEIVEPPDLLGITFDAAPDHSLAGQTTIEFTVANQGIGPAGAFKVDIVLSNDATIGNGDDFVVHSVGYGGLVAGATLSDSIAIAFPVGTLYGRAISDDRPNLGIGHVSTSFEYVGIVIDPDNQVSGELSENNNSNQGKGIDKDDVTYFPFDIDSSGIVTQTDADFVINGLGQTVPPTDARADLDGNGVVTPTDAIALINRLGYERNNSVVESPGAPVESKALTTSETELVALAIATISEAGIISPNMTAEDLLPTTFFDGSSIRRTVDALARETTTVALQQPRPVPVPDEFSSPSPSDGEPATISSSFLSTNADPEGDMPHEVVFTPDGSSVLVVNRDTDNLVIFDVNTRTISATIGVGDYPVDVAVSPDGRYAIVPNVFSDTVSIVDLPAQSVAATIAVTGTQPYAVEVTSDGAFAVVGVINDGVNSSFSVISLSTLSEVRSFASGPQGTPTLFFAPYVVGHTFTPFSVSSDNATVVLPDRYSSRVLLYDLNTGMEWALATAEFPGSVDISSDGTTAIVGHLFSSQTITVVDLVSRTVTASLTIDRELDWVANAIRLTPDKNFAIAAAWNEVIFVDLSSGMTTGALGGSAGDIETSYDGQYAFASGFNSLVIDIDSQTLVASLPLAHSRNAAISPVEHRAVALNNWFGEDVHFYNTDGAAGFVEGREFSGVAPEGDATSVLAVSQDGMTLVAGNSTSKNISIIDLATQTVRAYVDTGDGVFDAAITPDGAFAVVANLYEHTVSVIDLATDMAVATLFVFNPLEILISADSQTAYVNGGGVLHFIQLAGAASSVVASLPAGGTGMALTNDGSILALALRVNDEVILVDTASRMEIARIAFPPGSYPTKTVFSPDGSRVFVTNFLGNSVSVIDVNGPASSLTNTVGGIYLPTTINVDATGTFVYVGDLAFPSSNVNVIDIAAGTIVQSVPLLDWAPTAGYFSQSDSILYLATGSISIGFTPDSIDDNGTLYRINAAGPASTLIDSTPLTGSAWDLAFSEAMNSAMVAHALPDGVGIVRFDPTVESTMELVDLDGLPGIFVGEQFDIKVRFTDVRDPMSTQAVFSGYADIEFDPTLLSVDGITHDPDYMNSPTGSILADIVDEVGGTAGLPPGPPDNVVLTLHVTALAQGITTVQSNAGEALLSQIVVFGNDYNQRGDASFGSLQIQIDPAPETFPEIDVLGNGMSIADGDMAPSAEDHTDFGGAHITGVGINRLFTIKNTGNANLNLGTAVITGMHPGDFTVEVQPDPIVPPGGMTTLRVRFDPVLPGLREAKVEIPNDDADENPYDFAIQGTGTAPEIEVVDFAATFFGDVPVDGRMVTHTFTIRNLGNKDLSVGTVTIIGTHAADFMVTDQPDAVVPPGGMTTFDVKFDPSAPGLREATVRIPNDDLDENPYDFAVQGTGTTPSDKPKDPGFSYVDRNNDHRFSVIDGDVGLTSGEVADGRFDTKKKEGNYTTILVGAGLVVNGPPISRRGDIEFVADGDLVINTDLAAGEEVYLKSRRGSVLLDDPVIAAGDELEIIANLDIVSMDDMMSAEEIELAAGRDIRLLGTRVTAEEEVEIEAGRDIAILDSATNPAIVMATDARDGEVEIEAEKGNVDISGAQISAGDEVEIEAKGNIVATGAEITALGNKKSKIELEAGGDIDIRSALLQANHAVALEAKGHIFAAMANLLACGRHGEVEIEARRNIDLAGARVRAFEEIEIESKMANVNLTMASIAIADGSTDGEIEIEANLIDIAMAELAAPGADIDLDGIVVGTAAFLGAGTRPC